MGYRCSWHAVWACQAVWDIRRYGLQRRAECHSAHLQLLRLQCELELLDLIERVQKRNRLGS
jgi:hypothetical protein